MVVASFQIAPGKAGRSLVTILGSSPSAGLTQRFTGAHQDPPPAPYEARRDRPDRPRPRGARHVRRDETREQELRNRPSDRAYRGALSGRWRPAGERRPIEPRRRLQARECPVDCAFTEDEVDALVARCESVEQAIREHAVPAGCRQHPRFAVPMSLHIHPAAVLMLCAPSELGHLGDEQLRQAKGSRQNNMFFR